MPAEVKKYTRAEVDALEVVPGAQRDNLQGWIPDLASESERRDALEKAFSYRGDVTMTLKNGNRVSGYIFDRKTGTSLANSFVQYFTPESEDRQKLSYDEIAGLEFSGKDCAAGKHWEDWVKKYNAKKAAGEQNIANEPEALD